jgi:hypothetical protein
MRGNELDQFDNIFYIYQAMVSPVCNNGKTTVIFDNNVVFSRPCAKKDCLSGKGLPCAWPANADSGRPGAFFYMLRQVFIRCACVTVIAGLYSCVNKITFSRSEARDREMQGKTTTFLLR